NDIAVLGVELHEVRADGYHWQSLSTYDPKPPRRKEDWLEYVRTNNGFAREFITANPACEREVYILTTASSKEFEELQQVPKTGSAVRTGHPLGVAWIVFCGALALHVTDEALTGFLSVYNPTVLALRQQLGFWPM